MNSNCLFEWDYYDCINIHHFGFYNCKLKKPFGTYELYGIVDYIELEFNGVDIKIKLFNLCDEYPFYTQSSILPFTYESFDDIGEFVFVFYDCVLTSPIGCEKKDSFHSELLIDFKITDIEFYYGSNNSKEPDQDEYPYYKGDLELF